METTTEQRLERFFLAMWDLFTDGCTIDGSDLQEALERSGLTEWRAATAEQAALADCDIEEGDPLMFPTAEASEILRRARALARSP
jgi:hypothetical protein